MPVLNPVALRRLGIALLYAALFGGRLTLDRVPGWPSALLGPAVRELATACCLFIVYLLNRRERIEFSGSAFKLVVAIIGLHAFLLIRSLISSQPISNSQLTFDLAMLPVQLAVVLALFRSREDCVWLAWVMVAGAAVFACLAIAGFGSPEKYGHGWSPLGSPITFQRVEITGFFAALYLFWRENKAGAQAFLLGLATLSLFASLASLLKAGVIAAVAGVGLLVLRDYANGAYRSALVAATVAVLSFFLFFSLRGSLISARTTEAFDQAGLVSADALARVADRVAKEVNRLAAGLDARSAAALRKGCDLGKVTDMLQTGLLVLPQSEDEYLCAKIVSNALYPNIPRSEELFVFADRTHRARLVARAWLDFTASPWWGNGLGTYRFVTTTSYDPEPKVYTYPHNIILEFLAGIGIIGTLVFIAVIGYAIHLLERARVFVSPERFWYAGAATVFVSAQFAGDYFDFRLVWFFALLALTMATVQEQARLSNSVA